MPINETISAAIYIGAYTAQMLIARMLPNGTSFETINQFTTFTDMALDRTEDGLLSDAGMKRVLDALREFHETARLEGVSTFYVAATSSLRKVPNRSLLLLGCQREFGTFPRLLSGRDELRLNFAGAVTDAMANLPVIVTYVGYSNFCFSYGTASTIDGAVELDLGVSKVDRHFKRRRHLTLFRQIALHRYVTKKTVRSVRRLPEVAQQPCRGTGIYGGRTALVRLPEPPHQTLRLRIRGLNRGDPAENRRPCGAQQKSCRTIQRIGNGPAGNRQADGTDHRFRRNDSPLRAGADRKL